MEKRGEKTLTTGAKRRETRGEVRRASVRGEEVKKEDTVEEKGEKKEER